MLRAWDRNTRAFAHRGGEEQLSHALDGVRGALLDDGLHGGRQRVIEALRFHVSPGFGHGRDRFAQRVGRAGNKPSWRSFCPLGSVSPHQIRATWPCGPPPVHLCHMSNFRHDSQRVSTTGQLRHVIRHVGAAQLYELYMFAAPGPPLLVRAPTYNGIIRIPAFLAPMLTDSVGNRT